MEDKKLVSAINGDGAEYFVASQIMLNLQLLVSIAPTAAPSWDLEVTHPLTGKSAKIQVKFRTRYNKASPHLRLRSGVNFDFLVLVETPLAVKADTGGISSKQWFDGLSDVSFNLYPTWIISKQVADNLMYVSSNKTKGHMVRSFRKPEHLFNWQIIKDALE
ncbi:hypothetical protein NB541_11635 [Vibrio parahaemolyticus]|nr:MULTISPECIES: hypothetical protein [Vibrio harveyi group]MBM4923784.1 hypothetical protein [Vibrio parahaemolyticus]MCR9956025.1 hypothetical protein [Vibrio parahaemolyticus]NWJ67139.1 hypothetical protein [Vibrio parahaemolyticus]HDM8148286.1 hypothetical protein [Vibrio harveyi]